MNTYPDINTTNLFGTKTVELYNNVNNTAIEFGFTLLGILAIGFVLTLILKPIILTLLAVKLVITVTIQIIAVLVGIITAILGLFYLLFKKCKTIYQNRHEIKTKLLEYKNKITK